MVSVTPCRTECSALGICELWCLGVLVCRPFVKIEARDLPFENVNRKTSLKLV